MKVYGRFKLNSQIFEGEEVRTVDVDVVRTLREIGTVETETVAAKDSIAYGRFLNPLVLKETVGAVLEPLTEKYVQIPPRRVSVSARYCP
ncbi:MAG: hypothetical protein R3C68_07245 [Myxococcota bacterium]